MTAARRCTRRHGCADRTSGARLKRRSRRVMVRAPGRGLSPLAVTTSTETAAPVVAGVRLRAGRAGSAKGAASMVTEGTNMAKAAGAQADNILVRGDSAYCSGKVVTAVVKAGVRFSFSFSKNAAVTATIATIPDEQYTPVHYPVLDANTQDPLFPVWRHHPFFTNNTEPVAQATSPTAATPSARPSGPTSSTDPGPTSPPGRFLPTPRGASSPRSPATCSAPPAPSPAAPATSWPKAPPYASI
jgi:hypothetical protein